MGSSRKFQIEIPTDETAVLNATARVLSQVPDSRCKLRSYRTYWYRITGASQRLDVKVKAEPLGNACSSRKFMLIWVSTHCSNIKKSSRSFCPLSSAVVDSFHRVLTRFNKSGNISESIFKHQHATNDLLQVRILRKLFHLAKAVLLSRVEAHAKSLQQWYRRSNAPNFYIRLWEAWQ